MGLMAQEEMLRLKQEIIVAHDSNRELEYKLCEQLLDLAQREQSSYYMTFARLYILHCALSLRDIELYTQHMPEVERSCRENDYAPMLLQLCNLNGLYYNCLCDEQSALRNFLEGITLGKTLGDMLPLAKIYNNMAEMFRDHGDFVESIRYYLEAYHIINRHAEVFDEGLRGFFLANIADSYRMSGDLAATEHYLSLVSPLMDVDSREMQLVRISRAALRAAYGDNAEALSLIDSVLDSHLEQGGDLMFAYEALIHIMQTVLLLHNEQYADRVMTLLQNLWGGNEIGPRLAIQNLYITCCRTFGRVDKLPAAYEEYYNLVASNKKSKNAIKCGALKSSVLLYASACKTDEYKQRADDLESMVYTDELTRLYNRRYFNKLVSNVISDMQTTRIGFIMIDIDCFKQYNDHYGHTSGDLLLQAAGDCLASFASEKIMPSRYGGDEFTCLCVNCTDDEISQYIENVCVSFARRAIRHERSLCGVVATMSAGYSSCDMGRADNVYTILSQADEALYASKLRGRNTSTCYQPARSK